MSCCHIVLIIYQLACAKVRNLLRPWLSKFCLQSLCLSGNEADESAIRSLWKLARSAQEIIACCAQLGEDDDVPGIVVQWLKNYFSNSAKVEADLNETRLRELLAMYQPGGNQSDPWARLQDFGSSLAVIALPSYARARMWGRSMC